MFFLVIGMTEKDTEKQPVQPEETIESVETEKTVTGPVFDVPALLGKNAFEIKEILGVKYGEPISFWEPGEGMFGPVSGGMSWWIDDESRIIFSFEYWEDGSVNNNILFLGGAREDGHTVESVLRAGNLRQDDQNYKVEINPLATVEMIDILVSPTKK